MSDYELKADRVIEVLKDCLYETIDLENPPEDMVRVEGILNPYGFNPEGLERNRAEIEQMLMELPETFRVSSGGGWSFLEAAFDRHGNHWAEHPTMDSLFVLGMAIGKVECLLPRDMWMALPGGMPYYQIKDGE